MEPRVPDKNLEVKRYFDYKARNWYEYTRSIEEEEFSRRTIEPVLKCIEKIAEPKEGETFYWGDLGSGSGIWTFDILLEADSRGYLDKFSGVEAWLVDISPDMLKNAKTILEKKDRYKKLLKRQNEEKILFGFANIDLRNINGLVKGISFTKFDFCFFHKVLSMLEYGKDVQKTFSALSKNTSFFLTAVKSKRYYNHKVAEYLIEGYEPRAIEEGCFEVLIPNPAENNSIQIKSLEDGRLMVNDDVRDVNGKTFSEYTYNSNDLVELYTKNNFRIIPSYTEEDVDLFVVGKPPAKEVDLFIKGTPPADLKESDKIRTRQNWSPIIQAIGVSKSSPYASLFPQ